MDFYLVYFIVCLSLLVFVASHSRLICHDGVLDSSKHSDTISAIHCPVSSSAKYCLSFTTVLNKSQIRNSNTSNSVALLQTYVGCESHEINCDALKDKPFFQSSKFGCLHTEVNGTSGLLCCCPGRHCNTPHHLQSILKSETKKCNNGTSQTSLEKCNVGKRTLDSNFSNLGNGVLLETKFCMSMIGDKVKKFGCDQTRFCANNGAAIELLEPQCFKENDTKICCCRGDNCNQPSMANPDDDVIKVMPQSDNKKIYLPILIFASLSGVAISVVVAIIIYKKCRYTTAREDDSMVSICDDSSDGLIL